MDQKIRVLSLIGIGRIFEDTLRKTAMKQENGLMPSCLSCESFTESTEGCDAASGARPPARIIAFGCNMYRDKDNIPF